jgi:LPS-assembly protein
LFYESESTAGWYERKFSYDLTNSFSAARVDTFHQVTLPRTFFNWLTVTPRVGGRYTYYSEADGAGATTDEEDRWVFNTGAEVSTKASRLWRGVRSSFWNVDGLRHIIQPSVNYVFVPEPQPGPARLPQFDYEVPSTRLLPIVYPDYNAIDAIDSQNVVRFGLRNKLQTKRKGELENLVHWALVMDWRLDPRPDQSTFSDLYSDIDLKPFSWLTISSETRYDIEDTLWPEVNTTFTFRPNDRWSWSVGQRYLRDDPSLGPDSGNNLFFSTLYYRVSENWGLRMHHRFEANKRTLEEQSYTLYRDLRSWTAAVTVRIRDDSEGPLDVTAAVTFSLKAFPRYHLGDDVNRPTLLLGH